MKCSQGNCQSIAAPDDALCRFHIERRELLRRRQEQRAIAEHERGEKADQ